MMLSPQKTELLKAFLAGLPENIGLRLAKAVEADHLAGFVEILAGTASTVCERSQVRDGIRGRHTAVFQGFEAGPMRRGQT